MARFRSGGRIYEITAIDEITPRDLITFPRDAAEVRGSAIAWADVERYAAEIDGLPDDEKEAHPEFGFVMAVTIWSSRKAAGDKITFGECLDEPFVMLEDPEDHQPGKSPARKGKKKASPKGSGRVAKQAAPSPTSSTPPTSGQPSETASAL